MRAPSVADLLGRWGLADAAGRAAVLRRDFSGVTYLVARDLSREAASALAAHFNGLGHHQHYWVVEPWSGQRALGPGDIVPPP